MAHENPPTLEHILACLWAPAVLIAIVVVISALKRKTRDVEVPKNAAVFRVQGTIMAVADADSWAQLLASNSSTGLRIRGLEPQVASFADILTRSLISHDRGEQLICEWVKKPATAILMYNARQTVLFAANLASRLSAAIGRFFTCLVKTTASGMAFCFFVMVCAAAADVMGVQHPVWSFVDHVFSAYYVNVWEAAATRGLRIQQKQPQVLLTETEFVQQPGGFHAGSFLLGMMVGAMIIAIVCIPACAVADAHARRKAQRKILKAKKIKAKDQRVGTEMEKDPQLSDGAVVGFVDKGDIKRFTTTASDTPTMAAQYDEGRQKIHLHKCKQVGQHTGSVHFEQTMSGESVKRVKGGSDGQWHVVPLDTITDLTNDTKPMTSATTLAPVDPVVAAMTAVGSSSVSSVSAQSSAQDSSQTLTVRKDIVAPPGTLVLQGKSGSIQHVAQVDGDWQFVPAGPAVGSAGQITSAGSQPPRVIGNNGIQGTSGTHTGKQGTAGIHVIGTIGTADST